MNYFRLLLSFCVTILSVLFTVSCKPRCPIPSCQVRMVHPHGETNYRGQPIYRKQNPRVGEKLPKLKGEPTKKRQSKSKNKN